nr:MAG TPA: tail tape measure [Caudoviricetes sp.]
MRLTDEYTATMSKIIRAAEQGGKAAGNAEKEAKSLNDTLRNTSPAASLAQAGVNGLVGKLTTLVSTVYLARKAFGFLWDSIQTGATQQTQRTTFQSLLKNQQLGTDLYDFVTAFAKGSTLDRQNAASATTSFLAFTHDINQLQQLLSLTQRLNAFNPEQGAEGAVFALKEVLTGQTMSLKNRFNMNGVSAEQIQKFAEKGDITGTINYLDQVFNRFGATQGVVDANFDSLTFQSQRFKKNLMDSIGDESSTAVQTLSATFQRLNADMDAGKFQPFFTMMANGTSALANGLSWVAQNAGFLIPTIGGVVTALVVFNTAMSLSRSIAELTGATVAVVAGNWVAAAALIAGAATTIGLATSLNSQNDDLKKSAAALTTAQATAKFSKDQKSLGYSPKVDATITNKDPVKVSGTVEIEKENLKYVFEASTAKFFASFNATKVEPVFTVQNQNITEKADVQEINRQLAGMITEAAGVTGGGKY